MRRQSSETPSEIIARRAAGCACALSVVVLGVMMLATDSRLDLASIALVAVLATTLLIIHVTYTAWRREPRLGALAGGVAVLTMGGAAAGLTALAALRAAAPLVDASLARADAILGVDVRALVVWLAPWSDTTRLLSVAYSATVPSIFLLVGALALTGRSTAMWEAAFVFAMGASLSAATSALLPALGAFVHFDIPAETVAALPPDAGVFHLPVVEVYRSGAVAVLRIQDLQGVVTLPSFHVTMAMILAAGARHFGNLATVIVWAWSAVIVVSTIPIGGHYAVDLLAGAALWFCCVVALRALQALGREAPTS